MNTIKTTEYFKSEVFKTKEQIETYFETVEKAVEFFELTKSNFQKDLELCLKSIENKNLFNASVMRQLSCNNSAVSELIKTFKSDLTTTFENQIATEQNKIDALKTFL